MKNIKLFVISASVLGPAISYHSIYVFHIFIAVWMLLAFYASLLYKKCKIEQASLIYPLVIFFLYALISILWHPDYLTWFRYMFYLVCGFFALFSIYQYVSDEFYLNKAFWVIAFLVLINIFVGVLESLELARFPLSKYSPYADYFGYHNIDESILSEASLSYLSNKPSGFNFNFNSFGFVILLSFPFFLFAKSYLIKILGSLLVLWLIFSTGSRALSISLLFMGLMVFLYAKVTYQKIIIFIAVGFSGAILIILIFLVFDLSSPELARIYTSFDQIKLLYSLFVSGDIIVSNSTTTRAFFYYTGIQELILSGGLGRGFGGIEYILASSFHFFFLQLLVDLGVLGFIFFLYFYMKLVMKLKAISFLSANDKLSYYARASSLALLTAIPASIAPSGIHYLLIFYLLIGFALGVVKIYNLEKTI